MQLNIYFTKIRYERITREFWISQDLVGLVILYSFSTFCFTFDLFYREL